MYKTYKAVLGLDDELTPVMYFLMETGIIMNNINKQQMSRGDGRGRKEVAGRQSQFFF